ncbi:photoreceptor outer segment membrane glycoprotein 2 [Biomphalaria pfeifferi]|uniref:Photoreceptor outer segment membrane glycoprotein 2 n=1 Tax=Biomphalaria pfeifferi TaxID=112525 RepID=A0AAD8BLS8_BIOPF|nr:photoreceptor outer segment membrane glycoprotein 2 [Biomphalaria pfeifferi]
MIYILVGGIVLVVFEAASAITSFVHISILENEFKEGIHMAMSTYVEGGEMKKEMDTVQSFYACCGDKSYVDWFRYPWIDPQTLRTDGISVKKYLQIDGKYYSDDTPYSCCDPRSPRPCLHHHIHDNKRHHAYNVNVETTLYVTGCRTALMTIYGRVLLTVGLIATIIACLKSSVLLLFRLLQTSLSKADQLDNWEATTNGYIYKDDPDADVEMIKVMDTEEADTEAENIAGEEAEDTASEDMTPQEDAAAADENENRFYTKVGRNRDRGASHNVRGRKPPYRNRNMSFSPETGFEPDLSRRITDELCQRFLFPEKQKSEDVFSQGAVDHYVVDKIRQHMTSRTSLATSGQRSTTSLPVSARRYGYKCRSNNNCYHLVPTEDSSILTSSGDERSEDHSVELSTVTFHRAAVTDTKTESSGHLDNWYERNVFGENYFQRSSTDQRDCSSRVPDINFHVENEVLQGVRRGETRTNKWLKVKGKGWSRSSSSLSNGSSSTETSSSSVSSTSLSSTSPSSSSSKTSVILSSSHSACENDVISSHMTSIQMTSDEHYEMICRHPDKCDDDTGAWGHNPTAINPQATYSYCPLTEMNQSYYNPGFSSEMDYGNYNHGYWTGMDHGNYNGGLYSEMDSDIYNPIYFTSMDEPCDNEIVLEAQNNYNVGPLTDTNQADYNHEHVTAFGQCYCHHDCISNSFNDTLLQECVENIDETSNDWERLVDAKKILKGDNCVIESKHGDKEIRFVMDQPHQTGQHPINHEQSGQGSIIGSLDQSLNDDQRLDQSVTSIGSVQTSKDLVLKVCNGVESYNYATDLEAPHHDWQSVPQVSNNENDFGIPKDETNLAQRSEVPTLKQLIDNAAVTSESSVLCYKQKQRNHIRSYCKLHNITTLPLITTSLVSAPGKTDYKSLCLTETVHVPKVMKTICMAESHKAASQSLPFKETLPTDQYRSCRLYEVSTDSTVYESQAVCLATDQLTAVPDNEINVWSRDQLDYKAISITSYVALSVFIRAMFVPMEWNDTEVCRSLREFKSLQSRKRQGQTSADKEKTDWGGVGPIDTKPIDTKPFDTKPIDTKPFDTKPIDTKPFDTKPIDTKPIDTKPIDTKPIDTKPIDTKPIDTKPIDIKPIDIKPIDPKPIDTKPIDKKSLDTKPINTKPIDSKLNDTNFNVPKLNIKTT